MPITCIVGLGSPHGDDQFGWLVIDRLGDVQVDGVILKKASSPARILDWLEGCGRLWIVDACRGAEPGGVIRISWPAAEVEPWCGRGSHDYSLAQTLALAERLGSLPAECRLWCVAGEQFDPGSSPSTRLEGAVRGVVDELRLVICSHHTPRR